MAAIDSKEYNTLIEKYIGGRSWLNDVSVDIEEGENNVDPLILLRAYEAENTVDNSVALASQFIMNKHVTFERQGKKLLSFTYTGGDLSIKFKDHPWLLDVLLKLAYGLMLKKLTPPSEDSETEERQ